MSAIFSIDHACGHTGSKDLSETLLEERQKLAKWWATKDCTDCFKEASRQEYVAKNKAKWRQEEAAEIESDAQANNLPPLQGSQKQVTWANRIRFEMLKEAYEQHVETNSGSESEYDKTYVDPVRLIQSAGWWIDHKDQSPDEVVAAIDELVGDGSASTVVNENPY